MHEAKSQTADSEPSSGQRNPRGAGHLVGSPRQQLNRQENDTMLDDTLENILRECGVTAQRQPLDHLLRAEDIRALYMQPGHFVDPRDPKSGEVPF